MIILDLKDETTDISRSDREIIAQLLKNDQVIVYPTDTLYGLGVDASSSQAVAHLYHLKGRKNMPVSVLLESVAQLFELAYDLSNKAQVLIRKCLPGALTVICKSQYPFAEQLVSDEGTIGFRVPGDAISCQIPALLGRPITTTSANPAGSPAATSLKQIRDYFVDDIGLMLDVGALQPSKGSTVVDLTTKPFTILREGEISRQTLHEFLN
ncbi:MAG: L-threonylcarbamoyladenylate synthase [Candidatus Marinimicrobia bacterium]|nr:L-threonylcarbamoyladenylate synthase [Candidatus Neomarinimicrobiota bacterium]